MKPEKPDLEILRMLFDAALASASPKGKFDGLLPDQPTGRTFVIGAGKAAASMAKAFEKAWISAGRQPLSGLVIVPYGHADTTLWIKVEQAGHPVPDQSGETATRRILDIVRAAGSEDLVVCLISGGASALLCQPAAGLELADKQAISRALLKSGAPISSINAVRKAMSAVKGGRLAAAIAPAKLITYVISDVPGDNPATIGSGPTMPADETASDAIAVLQRYNINVPDRVLAAIKRNICPDIARSPLHTIASAKTALDAAAAVARGLSVQPFVLGDTIEGEARDVAKEMANLAMSKKRSGKIPCVLLSGGETTVTVHGPGRGGRNTEFLLALALALDSCPGIAALACDSDGIDGTENNAGAWFDSDFVTRARAAGLDLRRHLEENDAYTSFSALDRLIVTGPTLTNVNDFRAILIR